MWFMILYSKDIRQENASNSDARENAREKHLARLKILQNENRLLIGGPFPPVDVEDPELWAKHGGFTGGIIIAKFNSLLDAKKWAYEDPYVTSGVFAGPVLVKPWFQTVGIGVNFGR